MRNCRCGELSLWGTDAWGTVAVGKCRRGEVSCGELSPWGTVAVWKCRRGELSCGELTCGELSPWGSVVWGTVVWGSVAWGTVGGEVSCGEVSWNPSPHMATTQIFCPPSNYRGRLWNSEFYCIFFGKGIIRKGISLLFSHVG